MRKFLLIISAIFIVLSINVNAATFTVTSSAFGTTVDGVSLQWAITQANATAGIDNIDFNIPGAAPHVINITSRLPGITEGVIIDASTQPLNGGAAAAKRIELNGPGATAGAPDVGFQFLATNCEIYGFYITNFGDAGIYAGDGFNVDVSTFKIGTTGNGNVISGNLGHGIYIKSNNCFNSEIKDNYIGISTSGSVAEGNGLAGIFTDASASNYDFYDIDNNVISSNQRGVHFLGNAASDGDFTNNYVGTNAAGTLARGNTLQGILSDVSNHADCTFTGNVISANGAHGIEFAATGGTRMDIINNKIGTDVTGTVIMGNSGSGIYVSGGNFDNMICTFNVISNNFNAIFMQGNGSQGSVIESNKIGTDITGAVVMGNSNHGINIEGTHWDQSRVKNNVISNCGKSAIYYAASAQSCDHDTIIGNLIGVNAAGTGIMANGEYGIFIGAIQYDNNFIGGLAADEGNVISNNPLGGVFFSSGSDQMNDTHVSGNHIGTDLTATATNMGNGGYGVYMIDNVGFQTRDNFIECNIIAYNTSDGVYLDGALIDDITISQNRIYCNDQGTGNKAITLANNSNRNVAAPVVSTATAGSVTGTYAGTAGKIEVFIEDDGCSGTQARYYLGDAQTVAGGNWTFTPVLPIKVTGTIVATFTDNNDNTSEISNGVNSGISLDVSAVEAACATPHSLPIELGSFSATCETSGLIVVEWTTLSEINNDYFTIEKSKDAVSFTEVTRVTGAGNSTEQLSYSYYDDNNDGSSYYRLKQTDYDGKYEYFDIVYIGICGTEKGITLYPNPATDLLNIKLAHPNQKWFLFNGLGQQLSTNSTTGSNGQVQVDLSNLSQGIYYIRVLDPSSQEVISKKILKQ